MEASNPRKFSEQARENMAAAHRGRQHSRQHRAAIAAAATPENIARASAAASEAIARRLAELGAVSLKTAAEARGIDYTTAHKWATRGLGGELRPPVFRGPRRMLCVREIELEAELAQWRCSWVRNGERCERYALLSERAFCHQHGFAINRGQEEMTAAEFAARHGIHVPYLLTRLEEGDLPGARVERGKTGWLLEEVSLLSALRAQFVCKADGCDRLGLAPSRLCGSCSSAQAVTSAQSFHAEIPSQLRALKRVSTMRAAQLLGWSPHRVREALDPERLLFGKVERLVVEARAVAQAADNDPRVCGAIGSELTVLRNGRPADHMIRGTDRSVVTEDEKRGMMTMWSEGRTQQEIATAFRVSRDQVKRLQGRRISH